MIIEAVKNTASITSSDNELSRSSESIFLQPEVEVQVADQSECEIVKYRVFKRQYKNTRNITAGIDFWHSNFQYDTTVVLIFIQIITHAMILLSLHIMKSIHWQRRDVCKQLECSQKLNTQFKESSCKT